MSQDIDALIKNAIQMKVIEAFNSTPEVVEKLVQAAFEKPVNEHGSRPDFNDKKMPWLNWLVGDEIRKAAQEAVREYMKDNREEIKARVKKAIDEGKFGEQIGEVFAKFMSEDLNWYFHLEGGN